MTQDPTLAALILAEKALAPLLKIETPTKLADNDIVAESRYANRCLYARDTRCARDATTAIQTALRNHGQGEAELCRCELSGLVHLIKDGKACELCEPKGRQAFTPKNVDAAFKWYEKALEDRPSPIPGLSSPQGQTDDDPSADPRWNEGCDFAMRQLCALLGVDPRSVSWDAATEELDGDVQAVIGNILRAKLGENWSPKSQPSSEEAGERAWTVEDQREAERLLLSVSPMPFQSWRDERNAFLDRIRARRALSQPSAPTAAVSPEVEAVASWITREFSGHGVALRREDDPPIPGEPLMSMAVAKEITRRAIAHFSPPTTADTGSVEGWFVKPEWRAETDAEDMAPKNWALYVGEDCLGAVFALHPGARWFAWMNPGGVLLGSNYPTREEAQAALLSAVRPKDGGAA